MSKTAICLLTKDKPELTRRSIKSLLGQEFDLYVIDGSDTAEGRNIPTDFAVPARRVYHNIRGGAGAGIVFALTKMLAEGYDYVGLCEQDVLCDRSWYDRAFALFSIGEADGLPVGAVSARCYEDRILFQRDGYAVCHNLGAGLVLFHRDAARLVLDSFRSGYTLDNRRIFCQLSGIDIGPFWAFRNGDHPLVADWHFDAVLAAHGYASLALTPSPVEMIGQVPPLPEQGLVLATGPVESRRDDVAFNHYVDNLRSIRVGALRVGVETTFQHIPDQGWIYTAHQLHRIGARWSGDWKFREMRGLGEFGWVSSGNFEHHHQDGRITYPEVSAVQPPSVTIPLYGLASLLVTGGKTGGRLEIIDEQSGYTARPVLPPEGPNTQALQIPLPATVSMRHVRVTFLDPGLCFLRVMCKERQPDIPTATFDYSYLPEPV